MNQRKRGLRHRYYYGSRSGQASRRRRNYRSRRFAENVSCWIPMMGTCFIILSCVDGKIPFLGWVIGEKALSALAVFLLASWSLYQMVYRIPGKRIEIWLRNILPTEAILFLVYCKTAEERATAFLLAGCLGALACCPYRKKNRARQAALILSAALLIPSLCAVGEGIGHMYRSIHLLAGGSQPKQQDRQENPNEAPKSNEEAWALLNPDERLDLLTRIVRYELEYMGVPPAEVYAKKLERDGENETHGTYNAYQHEISIDSQCLAEERYWDCLNIILHECFHAYEHHVVDWLIDWENERTHTHLYYAQARAWRESFLADKPETFEAYYWDPAEEDARDYAYARLENYYGY